MAKLSVNINKIATLRNARGGCVPNVVQAAIDCQKFGADGITIHPRPDERHITRNDVYDIKCDMAAVEYSGLKIPWCPRFGVQDSTRSHSNFVTEVSARRFLRGGFGPEVSIRLDSIKLN